MSEQKFYHDNNTLEEFVRRLANAAEYSSYSCGPNISTYWKEEAEEWVKELDAQKAEVRAEAERHATENCPKG